MTQPPPPLSSIDDLIVGHFDGTLTIDEEQSLATALQTSMEAKQQFLSYMRLEGRLHSLGHDGFLRVPNVNSSIQEEGSQAETGHESTLALNNHRRFRVLAASTSLAVCAAVLLMLSSGFLGTSSVSAGSILEKAQLAAEALVDRTYQVVISNTNEESRPRSITINARGGRQFLMRPDDGAYLIGNDGTTFWATRKVGPVWTTKNFRSLTPELQIRLPNRRLIELATSPEEPLLLGMADLVSLIKRRYNVQLIQYAGGSECHLSATAKSDRRNAPQTIDLWANVDTGVILRSKSSWANGRTMQFKLLESRQLSEQWYHHSEHASGRVVEDLDTSSPRP